MMIWRLYQMNTMNQAISEIGVVPVIKLNNPERDAAPLAKALCAGGVPGSRSDVPRSRCTARHQGDEGNLSGHDCRRRHGNHRGTD